MVPTAHQASPSDWEARTTVDGSQGHVKGSAGAGVCDSGEVYYY